MATGYLTSDTLPAATFSRWLRLPDDLQFIANVSGALMELTNPDNWYQYGAKTPDECAARMWDVLYEYWNNTMLGTTLPHFLATVPDWALACDGATHLRVDYPELYAVLAPALKTDADHFVVPNLNNNTSPRGTTILSQYGSAGGIENPVLAIANLPSHQHSEITATAAVGAAITGVPVPSAVPGVGVTGLIGGGASFNIQPRHIKCGFIMVAR